jgi:hypothetical protein
MKRFLDDHRMTLLRFFVMVAAWVLLLCPGRATGAELCGMALDLYADKDAPPDLRYDMVSPIKVILVIKNVGGFTAATERWFTQVDLYKSLILTDPSGKKFKYTQATKAIDMPPPFFLEGKAAVPAEVLQTDWARTVTVADLRELFPMMKTDPGWYILEAQQPFIKFGWTVQDQAFGVLGIIGHQDQCHGFISSNRLNIYVSPESGAQLQVRVLDEGSGTLKPISQVPVKVYPGVIAGSALGETWEKGVPVLAGSTNSEGFAVWGAGASCKPWNDYTAIAYHKNAYRIASFERGATEWPPGCSTTLAREIVFGEVPALSQFSVFAGNSVWIKANAIIKSGNVGVANANPGLWLDSGVEISVGAGARAEDRVKIFGDSIKLWWNASVYDLYYNDLQNSGTIRGEKVYPLTLPLPIPLPALLSSVPGSTDVTVKDGTTYPLKPGKYRDVKIGKNATLKLSSEDYHFRNLYLNEKSSVVCSGSVEKPTRILISQRLNPGSNAKINAQGLAKALKFYIAGTNGNIMDLISLPKAAEIGLGNVVKANIFVPNGTLWIGAGSDITGSFIGKGVIVGIGTKVSLDSAF